MFVQSDFFVDFDVGRKRKFVVAPSPPCVVPALQEKQALAFHGFCLKCRFFFPGGFFFGETKRS